MKCPFCGSDNTRVIDSRPVDDDNSIRRRRICDNCARRFTTYERIEIIPMVVIKKDNNREPYDRTEREIRSEEIGEMVIKRLQQLDPVAYVRFASVYREFKDVETFMEELKKVLASGN